MSSIQDRQPPSCGGGCSRCGEAADKAPAPEAAGWRLAAAMVGAFLVPPAAALAGALVVGGSETGQFIGAMAGLALGVAVAASTARIMRNVRRGAS